MFFYLQFDYFKYFFTENSDTNHAAQVNNGTPQKGSVCVS